MSNYLPVITGVASLGAGIAMSSPAITLASAAYLNYKAYNFIYSKLNGYPNKTFFGSMGLVSAYKLIDSGISHLFNLETLVHGTGIFGYMGISRNGADPNFGGKKTGSTVILGTEDELKRAKRFFYVFKDSALPSSNTCINFLCKTMPTQLLPSLLARFHAFGSGISSSGFWDTQGIERAARRTIGAIVGLITPTLKFRFKPEEILQCQETCRFEDDPDYGGVAYRTPYAISPSHIGLMGSLSQGIDSKTFSRMYNNPMKVLTGVALIASGIFLASSVYKFLTKPKQIQKDTSSDTSLERSTSWQNFKTKAKIIAIKTGLLTFAVASIFANTL